MLTKEHIKEVKSNGNGGIGHLVKSYHDSGSISFILENLGHLPNDFDGSFLPDLLQHKSSNVRLWTVKTIGKLSNDDHLKLLKKLIQTEQDTTVRREAVSSIGRMRNPKAKKYLFEVLNDNDPKVVCQAIRGLLVFRGDKDVEENLQPLINHQNEMVRTVIYKEFFAAQDFYYGVPLPLQSHKPTHRQGRAFRSNLFSLRTNANAEKRISTSIPNAA